MVDPAVLDAMYVDEHLPKYLENILSATRALQDHGLPRLEGMLESGAPPEDFDRILRSAKERAVHAGRKYVTPEDIRSAAQDTLTLTLILSSRAEARGLQVEQVVQSILDASEVP